MEGLEAQRPLLVLGIDRSGTSLLSELLYLWGAYPGDQGQLPEADGGNPQGYWEYSPMQDFVAHLVQETGRSWADLEFPSRMRRLAADPELRRRALDLAAGMEVAGRPWFWKEPEFVFSLPFWREIFAEPVFLITLRSPSDSAVSYERLVLPSALQDRLKLTGYFFLRWQLFMLGIFDELKLYPHKLIVAYEDLLSSPLEQCQRICRFLDAAYRSETSGDAATIDRMVQAIDPRLWRNRQRLQFSQAPEASRSQKELYSYLMSRIYGDVDDFDPARYPFAEGSREYLSNMSVFTWLLKNM